ncbi:trigger factor [Helicobacter cappadocius]|uniref:Trigger factor n=1 Tax=Helicobacter cappadocius TaxID=3063998 RepID=A0AA90PT17_9HELI|nr:MULTISPECIES: trigger factor [unclassified Helicobacter]MDO7252876.1 trigger factor [Helicobacter sp. faydin-H75]MDP2538919.1 trigger factor [Helicobacter sp. faydin-H76]
MNLQTKKINSANASVSGEILLEDLEKKLNKIATKISKTVKMDGFRKGKVPLNVVKSRYKENIEQDAQKEAVEEMLQLGLKELQIDAKDVIGDPIITEFDKKDTFISTTIKISLKPDFKLDNIDSYVPDVKLKQITNKQIEDRLNDIAKNKAPLIEAKKDKKLDKGDTANIDFKGFIDDKAFEGGEAKGFDLNIGSGQFIPGFEDALVGLKVGEEKDIDVSFPENYQAPNLAGKAAVFKVKLNKIQVKDQPKIDDELAKSLLPEEKEPSLVILKEKIREQLELESKTKLYNEELKEKLIENLNKGIDFDLPDLIVEQEMDLLFRNSLNILDPKELESLKSDPKKAQEKRNSFKEEAQKSVKITFIVDLLSKQENISVEDNEVLQTVYYESMMSGQNPKDMIEYYKKNNLFPALKMAMIEDKILVHLLDKKLGKNTKSEKPKEEKLLKKSKTEEK